jgi:Kef-type K+ transport system membrane component KefB
VRNPQEFIFLQHDAISTALFGIAVVFGAAWLFGEILHRLGQPRVVGEMVAGLVLGPSVIGSFSFHLFPNSERPTLGVLAQIGVSLFMFLVGLEIDFKSLRQRGHQRAAGIVTVWGMGVPFIIGVGLAFVLFPTHRGPKLLVFCLFIGVALAITAFPVLARIVMERGLTYRPLGSLAMLVAAGSDLLTWAVLIVVLSFAVSGSWLQVVYFLGLAAIFVGLMLLPVRRILARFSDRTVSIETLLVVVAGILGCATFTAAIGFHEILGAFVFGAVFPRGAMATRVATLVEPIGRTFLPVFFVSTGLMVDVHQIGAVGAWQLGLVVVAACVGKIVGVGVGARSVGLSVRDATGLGILMNTRGLTGVIVLTVGLQAHILDARLFTIFVLMSIITTAMTGPLLNWVRSDPYLGAPQGGNDGLPDPRPA